jgi:MFS family permease
VTGTPPRAPPLLLPLLLGFVALSSGSASMVNVALPFIGADLAADEGAYGWVVSGFSLTFGVFSSVHGRLGDVFGARRVYLLGVAAFTVTAAACAFAPSIGPLVALRVLQGIGAAAIPSLGATIIGRCFPPEERAPALGSMVATVGITASIAPFIGGLVLSIGGWRAVVAAPAVGILLLPTAWRSLPADLDEIQPGARFDTVGAALLSAGAAGILLALDRLRVGEVPLAAGLGVGAAAALAAFAAWIHRNPAPFAPPALLRDARFAAAALTGGMANAGRFGTAVLVPIMLVDVLGAGAFSVGLALLPGAAALTLLSRWAGRLSTTYGSRRVVMPASIALAASCALSSTLADDGVWGMAVAMTAFGAAFAFVQPPLLGALSGFLPREHLGVGNGVYLMLFFLGGAFGVSFSLMVLGLQPADVQPWFGAPGPTARFANAMLALGALAVLPLPFLRYLPARPA